MQKPLEGEYNPYFKKYIDLVPEGDFLFLLKQNLNEAVSFFESIPFEKHNYQYAVGKWTIKEVLMHIMDTERVMSYRALVSARADKTTILYTMDEDLYAAAANVNISRRTMEDLLIELKAIRVATEKLYENITENQSKFLASGLTHPISARALGYIMIGHVLHHLNVVKERYL